MGQDLAYDKNCEFRFGSYVESHGYFKITNDMKKQTVSVICLVPTANLKWSYKIFSLNTGRVVTRKHKIQEIQIPT